MHSTSNPRKSTAHSSAATNTNVVRIANIQIDLKPTIFLFLYMLFDLICVFGLVYILLLLSKDVEFYMRDIKHLFIGLKYQSILTDLHFYKSKAHPIIFGT